MPPPRLRLRPALGQSLSFMARPRMSRPPACLFCSYQLAKPRPPQATLRRAASTAVAPTVAETASIPRSSSARADLERALNDLQKHAGVLVNLSRIQLAIRGLQQEPGRESIRVAVLGLANGSSSSGATAKELLRLILADPLKSEESWEAQLLSHDAEQPLIVRVQSPTASQHGMGSGTTVKFKKDGELDEIAVSSPAFNGSNIEFLVMESDLAVPSAPRGFEGETEDLEETILVPTVEIPVSQDGRHSPVTTPVHQALVAADGFVGAAAVSALPLLENKGEILAAVNLKSHSPEDVADAPFAAFDAASSAKAISLFRESVSNAKAYETLWLRGGVPGVLSWLRAGALNRTDGTTKPAVRGLVASVLRKTLANIQDSEAKQLSANSARQQMPAHTFASLNAALAEWAETSHAELQEQLDLAFSSRRWRKLGWWKLFWRADDVTMLSSSLVAQRFLPQSEQRVVYLAGRIEEAARHLEPSSQKSQKPQLALYAAPTVLSPESDTATASAPAPKPPTAWPTNISFTRSYLLSETVPALQALAQKLVLQTLGTSGLTTALAVLTYLSSLGAYEAGAVAALGLVWSLGRMQKQWETARDFWEGEVREEGRKAVRAVEASVAKTLDQTREAATSEEDRGRMLHDLRKARELVEKANEALERLK